MGSLVSMTAASSGGIKTLSVGRDVSLQVNVRFADVPGHFEMRAVCSCRVSIADAQLNNGPAPSCDSVRTSCSQR